MNRSSTGAGRVPRVRSAIRATLVAVVVLHGLLHLLGAAKGLGWTDVTQLTEPISTTVGVAWLAGAVLVVGAGMLLAAPTRWWWALGGAAAISSQALISTSWTDAKAGTAVNVILAATVVHEYAARGPRSLRVAYQRQVSAALAGPTGPALVSDVELARLPTPIATYIRRSGAVGQPRVADFRARIHGRIRGGTDKPWMVFTGEQVNTYGPSPSRLFFIDATMFGLPVDVLHMFIGPSATMRVKLVSLITMVDASGPELDRAETVTLFNDLCVLAPSALVDAAITWLHTDDQHVRGTFTKGDHAVTADLVFDDDGDLADFSSDDRSSLSADGKHLTQQRWSTPIGHYRTFAARRAATYGEARWHTPPPAGEFTYLEYHLDSITYNIHHPHTTTASAPA